MQNITPEYLYTLSVFDGVPHDQLLWFFNSSSDVLFRDAEQIIGQGELITGPHVVIAGRVNIFINQGGSEREITLIEPGEIFGYLPFSRSETAAMVCQAIGEVRLLSFPRERVREMVSDHYELTQALVQVMTRRIKNFTTLQQQNEKMMALGKLSSGLTHELNNPASAIVRDSVSLRAHLRLQPETFKAVIAMRLDDQQVDALNNVLFELLGAPDRPRLTLKERTSREDLIGNWLESHHLENDDDLTEVMVDFGFDTATLEQLLGYIPADYLQPVFGWIRQLLITEKMVENIQESSRRIADLLRSVKIFTHMDRSPEKQFADIHTGIRNTLTMLGHKIRQGNVRIIENYDESIPPVRAYIGELNQVWTNLLDNALDAMEPSGQGQLTIASELDRSFVQVSVTDNGPGIPEQIRSKIFDPFFTTKEIGKGTGMGLDVVQRIVLQHKGSIKLRSVPGQTSFVVCFPIDC